MADRGGGGHGFGQGPRGPTRFRVSEPGAGTKPSGFERRRAAAYVVAAVAVVLLVTGYGAWRWHGRGSPEAAARLVAEGQYRAAIRVLQARLAMAPGDARLHYYLGLAYAGADVRDGAINQLREAVDLAPHEAPYHQALGQAYREAGDLERARGELEEAVRLDPADPRYEASLASLLLDQGQTEAALARLRHAVEQHSQEPELRFLLAEALGQAGDRDGMLHEYREVTRLAAGRPLAEAARQELRAAVRTERSRTGAGSFPGWRIAPVGTPPARE
jgi:Flp pilus assembly protein TadD